MDQLSCSNDDEDISENSLADNKLELLQSFKDKTIKDKLHFENEDKLVNLEHENIDNALDLITKSLKMEVDSDLKFEKMIPDNFGLADENFSFLNEIMSVKANNFDTDKMELDISDNVNDLQPLSTGDLISVLEPNAIDVSVTEKPRLLINISAIPAVAKSDQAAELQEIEGLSVYNQDTLEAGILKQVDNVFEGEIDRPADETASGTESSFNIANIGSDETEMERSIRLGEMTPFGTILNNSNTLNKCNKDSSRKSGSSEMSILEKYLRKQIDLNKQHKTSGNVTSPNKRNKDPLKRKVLNRDGRKRKPKRKERLGTKTNKFVANKKPGSVPGETNYMYLDNATDSEYVPSESDPEYSDDDNRWSSGKIPSKKAVKSKRKKLPLAGYKLPEDWGSDDSDWESSDEEYKKKKRRSKKELDDGDPELFKLRLDEWKENNKAHGDEEKLHKIDDYKIPKRIWDKLYNYQKVGVSWLWELDRQGCGGILGDEMGLGKTVQVISFLYGLHCSEMKDSDSGYRGLGPSLIVCPTTVMHQWVREFHTWFPSLRVAILHESGTYTGKQRAGLVQRIYSSGSGILIMSYTGAVQYKDELTPRTWHYAILDEGHKIRNPDAQVTLVVKQLKTSHRIILSGSPMQNNLRELWSLFDFIFPGKLGTLPVFLEQFAVPITQGGYANASDVQVATAFKCATVLKDTISPYLLRRMKADVKSHINLPDKNEQVLFCKLTEEQTDLYKGYVASGEVERIIDGRLQIFMGLITLRKICNHPDLFSGGPKLFQGDNEEDLPEEERYGHWKKSGKMIVVETLLTIWKKQGHRVLLFTQGQQMLCILESFVKRSGYKYLKLDGTTSISSRQPLINQFNQDTSFFVMLLTTRVGGLGVNLTGANRVVIYDPDWNPATDSQARERAWRIGQKQSVTVYRLITAGTIEEKMYHRQIFKQFLTNKVLKDPRQRRFFKSNDLFELFTLKETNNEGSTETSAIFAGTDSEVKLDPSKSYRHLKKPRTVTELKKEAEKPSVTFSKKKIEHMKKLAQQLSMNLKKKLNDSSPSCSSTITSNSLTVKTDENDNGLSGLNGLKSPDNNNCVKGVNEVCCDVKNDELLACSSNALESNIDSSSRLSGSISCNSDVVESSASDVVKHGVIVKQEVTDSLNIGTSRSDISTLKDNSRKHNKKKKSKHKRFAKFEGETVPHLVKQAEPSNETNEEDLEAKQIATQDEYVLKKLFDKSGLQTAMKHDRIMEGGPSDYALVEGEAEKVATKAVAALKESRRECNNASSGLPTFTGSNGFLRRSKFSAGKKSESSANPLSSSWLLQRIRSRNLDKNPDNDEINLIKDMREFVSSHGGTATTDQLIAEFKNRLPAGKSPIFKSLLSKICVFYRAPDLIGYWTLRDEFL